MTPMQWIIRRTRPLVECFPRLALAYRVWRETSLHFVEPKATPIGFKLSGNRLMESGTFEVIEVEIVRRMLEHSDVFINVGANIGFYCCVALQLAKYTVAFEPIEENLHFLYHNLRANHWEHGTEVFPIALGNSVGIIEMFGRDTRASLVKGWAGASEKEVRLTPASTLDTVLGSRFAGKKCLILVDIEGGESALLEGAEQFLASVPRPMWLVEIWATEFQSDGVKVNPNLVSTFSTFWQNGYECWTADKHLRLVNVNEVKAVVATGKDTFGTRNFLFMAPGQKEAILGHSPSGALA